MCDTNFHYLVISEIRIVKLDQLSIAVEKISSENSYIILHYRLTQPHGVVPEFLLYLWSTATFTRRVVINNVVIKLFVVYIWNHYLDFCPVMWHRIIIASTLEFVVNGSKCNTAVYFYEVWTSKLRSSEVFIVY